MKTFKSKVCAALVCAAVSGSALAFDAKPKGFDPASNPPAPQAPAAPATGAAGAPAKPWDSSGPLISADTMAVSDDQFALLALKAAVAGDVATFEQALRSGRLKVSGDGKVWCGDIMAHNGVVTGGWPDLKRLEYNGVEEFLARNRIAGIPAPGPCATASLMIGAMGALDASVRGEPGAVAASLIGRKVWSEATLPRSKEEFETRAARDRGARKIIADIDANLEDGEKRAYAAYARRAFAVGDIDMGLWFLERHKRAAKAKPTPAWEAFDKAAEAKKPEGFAARSFSDISEWHTVFDRRPANGGKTAKADGLFFWGYAVPGAPWFGRGAALASASFVTSNMAAGLGEELSGTNSKGGAMSRGDGLYIHAADLASGRGSAVPGSTDCRDQGSANPARLDLAYLERARLLDAYARIVSDPVFDPNMADTEGNNLLHALVMTAKWKEGGQGPLIRDLLNRGADFTKLNKAGKTPLALSQEGKPVQDISMAFLAKPQEYAAFRFKGQCGGKAR